MVPQNQANRCSQRSSRITIASGGQFLNWQNQTPARVLYMDFELKKIGFLETLLTMTAHNNVTDQTIERNFSGVVISRQRMY